MKNTGEKQNTSGKNPVTKHTKAGNIFEQSLPCFRLSTLEKPFYLV
jgi:hypothetical protein